MRTLSIAVTVTSLVIATCAGCTDRTLGTRSDRPAGPFVYVSAAEILYRVDLKHSHKTRVLQRPYGRGSGTWWLSSDGKRYTYAYSRFDPTRRQPRDYVEFGSFPDGRITRTLEMAHPTVAWGAAPSAGGRWIALELCEAVQNWRISVVATDAMKEASPFAETRCIPCPARPSFGWISPDRLAYSVTSATAALLDVVTGQERRLDGCFVTSFGPDELLLVQFPRYYVRNVRTGLTREVVISEKERRDLVYEAALVGDVLVLGRCEEGIFFNHWWLTSIDLNTGVRHSIPFDRLFTRIMSCAPPE